MVNFDDEKLPAKYKTIFVLSLSRNVALLCSIVSEILVLHICWFGLARCQIGEVQLVRKHPLGVMRGVKVNTCDV